MRAVRPSVRRNTWAARSGDDGAATTAGAVQRRKVSDGVDAPRRHRCAKVARAARAIQTAGICRDAIVLVGFDPCCGEEEVALTAGIEDASVVQCRAKVASYGVDAPVRSNLCEAVESLIDFCVALGTPARMSEFE